MEDLGYVMEEILLVWKPRFWICFVLRSNSQEIIASSQMILKTKNRKFNFWRTYAIYIHMLKSCSTHVLFMSYSYSIHVYFIYKPGSSHVQVMFKVFKSCSSPVQILFKWFTLLSNIFKSCWWHVQTMFKFQVMFKSCSSYV